MATLSEGTHTVYRGEEPIGTAELAWLDEGMGVRGGRFYSAPGYETVRAVFRAFAAADGDRDQLARYYRERDALGLEVRGPDGRRLTACVHILDFTEQVPGLGAAELEIELYPPNAPTLLPYTEADWQAVCRVHDAARPIELVRSGVDAAAMRPMADVAERDAFHASISLVAEVDGAVVGFVSFWDDFVTWLYVDPACQGRGIGRALVSAALECIGDQAWATALASNAASIGLFRSFGMVVVKRYPDDREGHPCESVRLALPTSHMADPDTQLD